MSTAETIAGIFHATYETLAPEHGYETRKESAVPWEQVPENNRSLMIAVVQHMLDTQVITPGMLVNHIVEKEAAKAAQKCKCGGVLGHGYQCWATKYKAPDA